MMPVLQAREALMDADVIAWGSGNLKKNDATAYRSRLQRMARSVGGPHERGPGLAQLPPEQAKLALAAYGIGYIVVPPSQSPSTNGDLAEDAG